MSLIVHEQAQRRLFVHVNLKLTQRHASLADICKPPPDDTALFANGTPNFTCEEEHEGALELVVPEHGDGAKDGCKHASQDPEDNAEWPVGDGPPAVALALHRQIDEYRVSSDSHHVIKACSCDHCCWNGCTCNQTHSQEPKLRKIVYPVMTTMSSKLAAAPTVAEMAAIATRLTVRGSLQHQGCWIMLPNEHHCSMRFRNTTNVLAKRMQKYCRSSY